MAKAQDAGAELKPIPLPYEMELVEMKIKDKKFVKIMQGKEPSQVRGAAGSTVRRVSRALLVPRFAFPRFVCFFSKINFAARTNASPRLYESAERDR